MDNAHRIFDRELLARRRDRSTANGGDSDFLARRAAEDIAERLGYVRRTFDVVLDLGAGDGHLGRQIHAIGCGSELLVSQDLSPLRLDRAVGARVVADEELLPFRDGSFDLVVSALALQSVNDLPGTLLQIRRALKPDGLMIAALLGGQTLFELREAMVIAETETTGGASPRIAPFADVRELGGLLQRAGFALPVADTEVIEVVYGTPIELMRDLRGAGWSNVLVDRRRSPMRRDTLARAFAVYQERHARADGRVKATFEVVTLTGWAPHDSQQKPLRPGSASTRLADALGTTERPAGDKTGRR